MDKDLIPLFEKWSEKNRLVRWLHEGCHYLAARALGVKVVEATPTGIDVEVTTPGQMAVIGLAPAALGMAGIIGLVLLSPLVHTRDQETIFSLLTILVLAWLGACHVDLRDAWDMLEVVDAEPWQEVAFQLIPITVTAVTTLIMAALYLGAATESQKFLYQSMAVAGVAWALTLWKSLPEAWKIFRQNRI